MVKTYIALGSNMHNRHRYILNALRYIQEKVFITKISPFVFSRPAEDVKGGIFLNGVMEGVTKLSPQKLLKFLQVIEAKTGRNFPHEKGEQRTIDLDIIFYGNKVIRDGTLIIPHFRYRQRDFVIIPLCEIAPDFKDPETGETIESLKTKEYV